MPTVRTLLGDQRHMDQHSHRLGGHGTTVAADALSNSWGGGPASTLINDAIGRAVTQRKERKRWSCYFFAAGSFNSSVPASNNNTIAVIAMSMCNQRKSYTSCDGSACWGSIIGTNADVAPGKKYSPPIFPGTAGYSIDDYYPTFNGTSSVCPNTAGVMVWSYLPILHLPWHRPGKFWNHPAKSRGYLYQQSNQPMAPGAMPIWVMAG